MVDYPAISSITDPANVRVMLLQGKQQVNAPLTGLGFQPLDPTLTAIAALVGAANKGIYFTGADIAALFDLTAAGRALLDDADASAQLTTLGVSTFIKTLLDDADAATARATLGVHAYMIVEDQKASGTNGGTFTLGADRTRVLTTIVANTISGASLATNQITLPAGTFRVAWSAPGYNVGLHQSFLYNATDTAEVARGQSCQTAAAGNVQTDSTGATIVTIAASKAFEIRHRSSATSATFGFGNANSLGTEVYTRVVIDRVA